MKRSKRTSRRKFLRGVAAGGAAVSVGLPTFEYMLGTSGTALADGEDLAPLYMTWGIGNGHPLQSELAPGTTGQNYVLTEPLRGLEGVEDYVSIISNMTNPFGGGHVQQRSAQVTGTFDPDDGEWGNATGESLDNLLERSWSGSSPLGALHLQVSERGQNGGRGSTLLTRGEGASRKQAYTRPREVFDRLAGFERNTEVGDPTGPARNALDHAVLNAVLADSRDLRRRLSRSDQLRLDRHMDTITDLEREIGGFETLMCEFPSEPADLGYDDPGREPLVEKNRLMADLMVFAMQCGITRIGTFQFTPCQGDPIIWQEDATIGWHILSHDADPNPDNHLTEGANRDAAAAQVKRNFSFAMHQAGYLLRKMKDTPVGANNLLDQAAVMMVFELGEFHTHGGSNIASLLAGGGCGRLRPGVHLDAGRRNRVDLITTALAGVGERPTSFGEGVGRSTTAFDELLV